MHALVGRIGYLLTFSKVVEFYWTRSMLGLACAYCEATLFSTISRVLNPRVGIMFMIVMVSAPGMFGAAAAYLPSSFTMYTNMLGASAFMDWEDSNRTTKGIRWFGIGSILGWPFAGALAIPFLCEDFAMIWVTKAWPELLRRVLLGVTHLVIILVRLLAS